MNGATEIIQPSQVPILHLGEVKQFRVNHLLKVISSYYTTPRKRCGGTWDRTRNLWVDNPVFYHWATTTSDEYAMFGISGKEKF